MRHASLVPFQYYVCCAVLRCVLYQTRHGVVCLMFSRCGNMLCCLTSSNTMQTVVYMMLSRLILLCCYVVMWCGVVWHRAVRYDIGRYSASSVVQAKVR